MIFDGTREDFFPELMAWAAENGASTEGFEIANFPEEGFGLKATRDIKVCVAITGLSCVDYSTVAWKYNIITLLCNFICL